MALTGRAKSSGDVDDDCYWLFGDEWLLLITLFTLSPADGGVALHMHLRWVPERMVIS